MGKGNYSVFMKRLILAGIAAKSPRVTDENSIVGGTGDKLRSSGWGPYRTKTAQMASYTNFTILNSTQS